MGEATSERSVAAERRLPTALIRRVAGIDGILFGETLAAEVRGRFANACELGLERIVSKRAGSLYKIGPSRNRLKTNQGRGVSSWSLSEGLLLSGKAKPLFLKARPVSLSLGTSLWQKLQVFPVCLAK
jgi:hypothetical protein